jgi:hypothetical protein
VKHSLPSCLAVACCLALASACGPSATPAVQSAPSTAAPPTDDAAPAPLVYSKFTDPLFLALGEERNAFGRRTLARLWVVVANTDPPSDAQKARLEEATRAVADADRAVDAQTNACEARVDIALERAVETKKKLEQRYLDTVEQGGETSAEARSLDAQVHFLRDEVEALQALADPCPKAMFDGPPEDAR